MVSDGTLAATAPSPPLAIASSAARLRFFVCLGILIAAAASMQALGRTLEFHFRKQPLDLKKPLFELDVAGLAPDYTLFREQPERLAEDVIQSLGTQEFHSWNLVNQNAAPDDGALHANVFISYYTGKPDMVPHNPKECMGAGGFDLDGDRLVEVEVARPDGEPVTIPVSVLSFVPPGGSQGSGASDVVVCYFFYVNGRYVTERNDVRRAMQRLSDRYAYYSKIELKFMNHDKRRHATAEESIAAMKPLLGRLMPVLWTEHFQDWDRIVAGEAPVAASR